MLMLVGSRFQTDPSPLYLNRNLENELAALSISQLCRGVRFYARQEQGGELGDDSPGRLWENVGRPF